MDRTIHSNPVAYGQYIAICSHEASLVRSGNDMVSFDPVRPGQSTMARRKAPFHEHISNIEAGQIRAMYGFSPSWLLLDIKAVSAGVDLKLSVIKYQIKYFYLNVNVTKENVSPRLLLLT